MIDILLAALSHYQLILFGSLLFFTLDDAASSLNTKTPLYCFFLFPGYCCNVFCKTVFGASLFRRVVVYAFLAG
jgi:hypothetical protein